MSVLQELKYNRKSDEMVCFFFRGQRGGDPPTMSGGSYDVSGIDEEEEEDAVAVEDVSEDIAVMLAVGGMVFAVSETGEELWCHDFYKSACCLSMVYRKGSTANDPVAAGKAKNPKACFVAGCGHVHAVNVANGKKLWHKNISKGYPSSESSNMTMDERCKKLFVAQLGHIIAVDASTGATLWKSICPSTGFDQVTVLYDHRMGKNSLWCGSRGQVLPFHQLLATVYGPNH